MARMAIDDMIGRDPRVLRLAKLTGWSRRELCGALIVDIWPLCYDRLSAELPVEDVDTAAELVGFADLMVQSGLATRAGRRGAGRAIRLSGAEDRIQYLLSKRAAGRTGGLNSGQSRKNSSKHSFKQTPSTASSKREAPGNPPDLVPDKDPDRECDTLSRFDFDSWIPDRSGLNLAAESRAAGRLADLALERESFRDRKLVDNDEPTSAIQANAEWRLWLRNARPANQREPTKIHLRATVDDEMPPMPFGMELAK